MLHMYHCFILIARYCSTVELDHLLLSIHQLMHTSCFHFRDITDRLL